MAGRPLLLAKIPLESSNAVAETLLIALHARVLEAQRPAPLIRDDRAPALAAQIDYDFSRFALRDHDQTTTIMRLREFDRQASAFLARSPQAVVVHIGCGLDTRFDRVDNGRVAWYDLDLPEVIELRQQLIGETGRCTVLGCSVFDSRWLDLVAPQSGRPFLFLAEGVLPYFDPDQVRDLVQTLQQHFPGCELVFDALTPFMIGLHNLELRLSKVGARLRWALRRERELEAWGKGIRLLEAWYYFDRPEPRLGATRLMRYLPFFSKGVGVFHYRLGSADAPP
jgi:O-methyltransferase involved in polyketide biosynthesis